MEWLEPVPTDVVQGSVPSWPDGFLGLFGVALIVPLLCLIVFVVLGRWGGADSVRRRFWCAFASRNVVVEFVTRGLAPQIVAVRSCSAFDPATAVACRQQCLEGCAREVQEQTA